MIGSLLGGFARDLSRAYRSLRRTPGLALTIVLILGIAVGLTSAMVSVFEGILLRRLPVVDQDRVVTLAGSEGASPETELSVSPGRLRRFVDASRAFSGVAGYGHFGTYAFAIRDGERALDLRQASVTSDFFTVLGASPVLGRLLEPDDGRPWGPGTGNTLQYSVVLSYGAWKSVFAGDSSVLGRRLETADVPWNPVIVGVAPAGLDFPRGVDYWIAAEYPLLRIVARLAPGATLEAARAEYSAFLRNDRQAGEPEVRVLRVDAQPLGASIVGDVRPALTALTVAAGLLLLLACVNIANLLVLRASTRARELAIRRVLGAGTLAIVRELLSESILLAAAGGAMGLWFAGILLKGLLLVAPRTLPRADVVAMQGAPFAVAAAVTLLTLLLFGLLPAIGSLRLDLSSPIRAGDRSATQGRRLRRLRHGLAALQIALAIIVLAGAGLLVRSFANLARLDFGYATEHLSVMHVALRSERYIDDCGGSAGITDSIAGALLMRCWQERVFTTHDRVEIALAALPDVLSISSTLLPPFLGTSVWRTKVVSDRETDDTGAENPWFGLDGVGPDYFRTVGLPVLAGRTFTPADRFGSVRVAVISQDVARILWQGEDPVGRRFHMAQFTADSQYTVVGVVPDIHYREHRASTPTIYLSYRQGHAQGTFILRTRGPLSGSLPGIRSAIDRVDANLVLTNAATMDDLIAPHLAQPRLQTVLLAVFALTALILAAIGLYGVVAHGVTHRRRELGIRMALGATRLQVRHMILRQAFAITVSGAIVGLAATLSGSRLVDALLFEVRPVDPLSLFGVSLILLGVAMLAAYLPARRTTRIHPAEALRTE